MKAAGLIDMLTGFHSFYQKAAASPRLLQPEQGLSQTQGPGPIQTLPGYMTLTPSLYPSGSVSHSEYKIYQVVYLEPIRHLTAKRGKIAKKQSR